jgi:hypothetical protein
VALELGNRRVLRYMQDKAKIAVKGLLKRFLVEAQKEEGRAIK